MSWTVLKKLSVTENIHYLCERTNRIPAIAYGFAKTKIFELPSL